MPRLARLAALAFASLALVSTARADINLCNDFHEPIRVALAKPTATGVAVTGWWKLDPGVCHPIDYALEASELYYSAVSAPYRQGRETLRYTWGNKKQLPVGAKDFNFDDVLHARGARTAMFGVATLPGDGQAAAKTVTIHFFDGGTTVRVSGR